MHVKVSILRGERTEAMKAIRRKYGDKGGIATFKADSGYPRPTRTAMR